MERSSTASLRWLSWGALLVIALSGLTVFVDVALYFAGDRPFFGVWEDALMLTRYAHNFIAFHRIEWNPGGETTYGLTSPYYFLSIVVPVAKFITRNPLEIPILSSVFSGVLFFASITAVLRLLLPGPVIFRYLAMALAAIAVARNANSIALHFVSGMDTLFALFYMTLYIALARWHALTLTVSSALLCSVFGGFAFGARPDLLAWTMLIPCSWILLGSTNWQRQLGLLMVSASLLILALQLGLASVYFHSALPLPFYAKTMQLYPGLSGFRFTALQHFLEFLLAYWLLFVVIALDITVDVRGWWKDTSPLNKGLMAGVLIHMSYFLFAVTQIMPEAQRFYYPELPAVIFLAGCAAVRLMERIPQRWISSVARLGSPVRYGAFAAAVLVLPPSTVGEPKQLHSLLSHNFATMNLAEEYRAYLANYWLGLDRFSMLPPGLAIATTEVGHVGALNLDKMVIDIAGLNDPLFVHHRFSAKEFFLHYHPDLIYMAHPGYRAMISSFESNSTFQRDYEYYPSQKLGGETMGIALSRSSPYYAEMKQIVVDVCAARIADSRCWLK